MVRVEPPDVALKRALAQVRDPRDVAVQGQSATELLAPQSRSHAKRARLRVNKRDSHESGCLAMIPGADDDER